MTPIIDQTELDQQTFHDPDIRREVIGMFMEQAPAILAGIEGSTGAARADIAHRLRGSALALGAKPLAEAAARLEVAPADDPALGNVRRLLDATLQALRHLSA
jgi:HPt (histidine-containing phosphotransfer) domain-containing protein